LLRVKKINENLQLGLLKLPEYAAVKGLGTKRDVEKSGTRYLLSQLLGKEVEPDYTPEGKPFLNSEKCHISISHSHDRLAILVNTREHTGVDIELIREKVLKVKHKFLNKSEIKAVGDNIEKLIVYWGAKESLYKVYGLKEVDFARHLAVEDFDLDVEGELQGEIRLENLHKKYRLRYEKLEDYMLVYVLNELK